MQKTEKSNQTKMSHKDKKQSSNKNGQNKVQTKEMYKSVKTTKNKIQKHTRKHGEDTGDGAGGKHRT